MICSEVVTLTSQLISKKSITPNDDGCQELISHYLKDLNFDCEFINESNVSNLWAINKLNNQGPVFVFAGHTDVVPTGPIGQWQSPPFEPTIKHNLLYGRGAADMKGSIAAMLIATKNFLASNELKKIHGSIAFLITSDEEGPAIHGTKHVVDILKTRGQQIDYCIVGEPSSRELLGDVIKNGRRGSLTANLVIHGCQGHVAYPNKATNAIHISLAFLQELTHTVWDDGNNDFPPTSMQIVNMHSGTGAANVIPGSLNVQFNFRYASCSSHEILTSKTEALLNKFGLTYEIVWQHSAQPFLTKRGNFTKIAQQAVKKITNNDTILATDGGTSDGRFISPAFSCELLELGPKNHCIHKIDEHVDIDDLNNLAKVYEEILAATLLNK